MDQVFFFPPLKIQISQYISPSEQHLFSLNAHEKKEALLSNSNPIEIIGFYMHRARK